MSKNSISYLQYRYYHNKSLEKQQPLLVPYTATTYETNTSLLETLDLHLHSNTFPLNNSTTTSTIKNELYIYNIYNIYNLQNSEVKALVEVLG